MPAARVLCLGDLHLGVRPSRLPSAVDPREHATAAAWRRAVDLALDEGVGLVLLSGDVVDRANRYFEAFGPLEEGIRRLAGAGVEVCAVAGNHDFDVLPRLSGVAGGERFHLLGREGRWQRHTWRGDDGRPLLHVDGWSFPSRDVTTDPLESYGFGAPEDDAPVIGLVHGDLGQPASTNAPLSRAGLDRPGPAAWVMGHIHKPEVFELAGGRWALYPGSPQPLAKSETGIHGAWVFDLEGDRVGRPEQAPLATMRHEPVEVDLAGAGGVEDVRDLVTEAARRAAEDVLTGAAGDLRLVLPRPRLTGRTAAHRELPELARRLAEEPLDFTVSGVRVVVADLLLATRPAVDLDLLAGDDPPGLLADLLRDLEEGGGGSPELADLVARAASRVEEVRRHRPYLPLENAERDEAGPGGRSESDPVRTERERLAAAAGLLLDALLAQKPDLEERLGGGGGEPPEGAS